MSDRSLRHDDHVDPVVVEVLYFADCPNHAEYLPHLRRLLARTDRATVLIEREVASDAAALAERFLGSPTVRIDGVDVDPGAAARTDYGLQCRLYRAADRLAGAPPDGWVIAALSRGPESGRPS